MTSKSCHVGKSCARRFLIPHTFEKWANVIVSWLLLMVEYSIWMVNEGPITEMKENQHQLTILLRIWFSSPEVRRCYKMKRRHRTLIKGNLISCCPLWLRLWSLEQSQSPPLLQWKIRQTILLCYLRSVYFIIVRDFNAICQLLHKFVICVLFESHKNIRKGLW